MNLRVELARLWATVFRLRTLALARWAFPESGGYPNWVERPLFGYRQCLDLSRSSTHQMLYLEGERAILERELIGQLIKPGMTVVDVGANIGYYVLLFSQRLRGQGTIHAIEPSPENLPELRRTVERNALAHVRIHAVALGAEAGTTGLRTGINSGVVDVEAGVYQCPVHRLDQLVQGPVDVIKIDVEGFEGQVLADADQLIAAHRPTIYLELHPHIVPRFGYSAAGILEGLRKFYRNIELYEAVTPETSSLFEKIAIRYLGKSGVRRVSDPEEYVRRHDASGQPHTYWAICKP